MTGRCGCAGSARWSHRSPRRCGGRCQVHPSPPHRPHLDHERFLPGSRLQRPAPRAVHSRAQHGPGEWEGRLPALPDQRLTALEPMTRPSLWVQVMGTVNQYLAPLQEAYNSTFLEELWLAIEDVIRLAECEVRPRHQDCPPHPPPFRPFAQPLARHSRSAPRSTRTFQTWRRTPSVRDTCGRSTFSSSTAT